MSAPHLLIRASAGTGKTWRLTHRLIALLAQGAPPHELLASTFTRKAAGEILQRLVARLAEAATDARALEEVNVQLAREPGGEPLDAARARALLLATLRQLQRVEVRTLDAFFHQLARVHAWELDVPPGWTLAQPVDEQRLQADAVARVVARADREQLRALLETLAGGAPKRAVLGALLERVRSAHAVFLQADPGAWEAVGPPAEPDAAAVEAARQRLLAQDAPGGKTGKPNANWVADLAKLRAALEAQDLDALRGCGLMRKVAAGESSYARAELAIPGDFAAAARVLLCLAAARDLQRVHQRVGAWRRLLADHDAAFDALARERRLLRFEDVPRALQRAGVPGGDEGALALRLDGGLRHVLLDEFQDTSTPQWQVLAPLLRRALADARRHVFVVGDTKQSIYGWRAGEPRLLGALAGMGLLSEDIALSRRSAPAVMEAVNALFADLPSNPGLGDEPAVADAARDWHGAAAFPHHETARQQLAGAVRLWELPTPDESGAEERRTLLAQAAADLVARLVQADPRASVGVLVRVNKPIPRLLHALRARGVPASGEGGNALTDSEAVLVLLSLLLLADHPGDTAAAFHVATSPLGPRLGLRFGDAAGQQALAERVRSALLAGGYGAWLDQRLADVRACPEFSAWDRRRAAQLVDLGHAWDARATLRPGDFVAHVRGTPIEDPATARVRVLTVHAAKGLEFDAVVCPDLERDPLRRRGEPGLVWDRADPQGAISGIFLRVSRDKAAQAGHGSLVRLLDAALQREVREELCVLYVALTRARRRLDLLVSAARPAAVSFAALLRHALQQDGAPGGEPGAARRLHQARDAGDDPLLDGALCPRLPQPAPAGAAPARVEPPASAAEDAGPAPLGWRSGGPRLVLSRRTPSAREGGGRWRAGDLLALEGGQARLRGSVLHAWMASVGWSGEATPGDAAALDSARRLACRAGATLGPAVLEAWLAEWRAALARPATRDLLARPACAARNGAPVTAVPELWRERAFLLVDREAGEEILVPGAFDRVVLWRDASGAPLAAEIVDFKSDDVGTPDAPDTARLDARAAHYAPQLLAYRRALQQLTGLPPERIACRLLFLGADVVRDVPAA